MALTTQQKVQLSELLRREDAKQQLTGVNSFLADFVLLTRSQQIAFARTLVQVERDRRDAKIAAIPTEAATATNQVTVERDEMVAIDNELQGA